MPLIRARALYGGSLFRKEVRAFVQQVLCRPEPAEKWHAETARMRDRVRKEHKPRGLLDLRYGIGGTQRARSSRANANAYPCAEDSAGAAKKHRNGIPCLSRNRRFVRRRWSVPSRNRTPV